jgi:tetratricopeptide (TPR) repeat protein
VTPERYQQVKSTLATALECDDTQQRVAFLAHACGEDAELHAEVQSLLSLPPDDFDEVADTIGVANAEPLTPATAGRRIGAYELVRELGRGGMGTVWLARRADAHFEKLVAIKLLKRGTDTDEVLSRFHAERRILARLDHPNIARLLDAGTTEDHLPYFVMEYVEGARVTDFVWAQNLTLGERLRLFTKICSAVQFAHQNLVVHRDLKPANILVTRDCEPKLLDFGVAKLLAPEDNALQMTLVGHERFTPGYASPEQVRGEPITTVSDVYSLGALFYEVLTGVTPHRFPTRTPSAAQIARAICEEEPIRPSAAAGEPEMRRHLRGDLDTILLRALAKDPQRRYRGAGQLADDLTRYLAKRPVRARPDTFRYRAGKFLRRNKTGTAATALLFCAIVAGAAATAWQARRAQHRFNDVRKLANSFLFEFHDAIATLPGTTEARRLVVTRALEYLDSLSHEAAGDRDLQKELAEAYLKVGDVQGRPYTPNLGDSEGALRSYTKAVEIGRRLEASGRGSKIGARRLLMRAHQSLAAVLTRRNETADAARETTNALALAKKLLKEDPQHAGEWQRIIATSHLGLGDAIQAGNHLRRDLDLYRAALAEYRRAAPFAEALAATAPNDLDNLVLLGKVDARLAGILAEIGVRGNDADAIEESLRMHAKARQEHEAAAALAPNNARLQRNIADGLVMSAYARILAARDLPQALGDCTRALQIETPLANADPTNAEAQQDLSFAHYITGRANQALEQNAQAAEHYRTAINILQRLIAAHPENIEAEADLENARRGLSETTTTG